MKMKMIIVLKLWIELQRLVCVVACVFTIGAAITFLLEYDVYALVLQFFSSILTISTWNSADYDEEKLEKLKDELDELKKEERSNNYEQVI